MLRMRARANGLRAKAACSHPGADDVVDERAAAEQEPGVFDPVDAGADVPRRRRLGARHRRAHLGDRKLERPF